MADPDEQRFAVRLFVSCQALEMQPEMQRIVDDLDTRRRALFEQATHKVEALSHVVEELTEDQRRELARWRNLARFQPAVVDYLKAQLLVAGKRYAEALAALERVMELQPARPALLLQKADLYQRLGRWNDALPIYQRVLAIDPDNAHAHVGLCRIALRRRRFAGAAHSALDALQAIHDYPLAHYLLGIALGGMKEYRRAAGAFRAAISLNPNFPEAHVRLAAILDKHLGDAESPREHRRLARRMRNRGTRSPDPARNAKPVIATPPAPVLAAKVMPPLDQSLIVVTGLPRSGTSMLMQMLAAGGLTVLTDGLRQADADNPRGYLEFAPVKSLRKDATWLFAARGKAVKIVAPLLTALPRGLACRVILVERELEEVLDSQDRMLERRNQPLAATAQRRQMLKDEFVRILSRTKAMLARRPDTELLVVEQRTAISRPADTAATLNRFLGGGLDVAGMAAAIDPALHRNRS